MNNKIEVIKRKAYGFHDLRYFALKINQPFTTNWRRTMIVKLRWTKDLSVHNETIDNQHKHLFTIINRLILVHKQGVAWQKVTEVIKELAAYSTRYRVPVLKLLNSQE